MSFDELLGHLKYQDFVLCDLWNAADRGSQAIETAVYVFVSPVYLLYVVYGACPFGGHCGKEQGYTCTDVG